MQPGTPLYDRIGRGYDGTRRADPYLASRLAELLAARPGDACLDLACGTGNYTLALASRGGRWTGVDSSSTMLARAREKAGAARWVAADAAALPFADGAFERALCTLAIHHFPALPPVFAELRRVLRAGRLVLLTAFPRQMERYWLREYFPDAMERAIRQMPGEEAVLGGLRAAGFREIGVEPYHVRPDLEDLFLYAGKHRPEIYLDPAVRAGISTFAAQADAAEVRDGCARLEADIRSGRIGQLTAGPGHGAGDYAFVLAGAGAG
jgi:SAM-dependent methyltransferase